MSAVAQERTLADWALIYARRGYEIFPLHADKTPATPNGMHDATSDETTVAAWWQRHPDALIGCRVPADMIILDIDPRHGGNDTWDALCEQHGHHKEAARWHASGRGDGGRHRWYQHPGGKLSTKALDEWARAHGVGHQAGTRRWSSGIDLLHHGHRYTILPPSPHPDTGKPYLWGAEGTPGALPAWLVELLRPPSPSATVSHLPVSTAPADHQATDSIADWFSARTSWRDILQPAGWYLIGGNGDEDGSKWRHPNASAAQSATVKHGCLFVYTPNTDFEPTEPGDPKGYTRFRAWATLEHDGDLTAAARAAREHRDGPKEDPMAWIAAHIAAPVPPAGQDKAEEPEYITRLNLINWPELWAHERVEEDWLVEPFLPRGRLISIAAAAKTGKSLFALDAMASLATMAELLGQRNHHGRPIPVLYLDMEMTPDDVAQRLEEMGYQGNTFSEFHYASLPSLPALNTPDGGRAVLQSVEALGVEMVVVDTRQRAISGAENDADPIREAYRCTFAPLKAMGMTVLRIDHLGKDVDKGARGTSALRDDVDIEWKMTRIDGGVRLDHRGTSRVPWVPQVVDIIRQDDPVLRHVLASPGGVWPSGTKECADRLDELGVPLNMGRPAVRKKYGASIEARNDVLASAIKFRKERAGNDMLVMSPGQRGQFAEGIGDSSGTEAQTTPLSRGDSYGDSRGQQKQPVGTGTPPLRSKGGPSQATPEQAEERFTPEERQRFLEGTL